MGMEGGPHKASTSGVSLMANEVVYENTHPSWAKWTKILLVAVLLLAIIGGLGLIIENIMLVTAGVLLAIVLFIYAYFSRKQSRYVVTDERVIKRVGLLAKSTKEVPIDNIQTIKTNASLTERLAGQGRIEITSAAADEDITIEGISNHDQVANSIRERQRETRAGG